MTWNLADRIPITKLCFKTESVVQAQRLYRSESGCRKAPPKTTIPRLAKRFDDTDSILRRPYTRKVARHHEQAVRRIRQVVRRRGDYFGSGSFSAKPGSA